MMCHWVAATGIADDAPSSMLNLLQSVESVGKQSSEKRVAVVNVCEGLGRNKLDSGGERNVLTNFGYFPQMVEGSAANFSDVLLDVEMCVQGNAKVANGVRRGNGRFTEQKRNAGLFGFAL